MGSSISGKASSSGVISDGAGAGRVHAPLVRASPLKVGKIISEWLRAVNNTSFPLGNHCVANLLVH